MKAAKFTRKSLITEEFLKEFAKKYNIQPMVSVNLYRALNAYADANNKKLTVGLLAKIPPETKIPKVGTVGRWLIVKLIEDIQ